MKTLLLTPVFLCLLITLNAQVAINSNNASPDSSAMLDIQSSDKGLLIPRMTAAQRMAISSPAAGLLLYQTDDAKGLWFYDGAVWMIGSVFTLSGDTISNGNGNYDTNDFVFGSPSLDDDENSNHSKRMFFDKSKGAFRAGLSDFGVWNSDSIGNHSFASGRSTKAKGSSSTAMGFLTSARGFASTATGWQTEAVGNYSTAIGYATDATEEYSMATGYFTDAIGKYSTAMGNQTTASGSSSIAMGFFSTSSGPNSTAMGRNTQSSSWATTSMGNNTVASDSNATAMGFETLASGNTATAMGISTTASGTASTAMGELAVANGEYTTAMGRYSESSGYSATALGNSTNAAGDYSTAIGRSTSATGLVSTSMGHASSAKGSYSTAIGHRSAAHGYASTVIGMHNDTIVAPSVGFGPLTPLFIIGNGNFGLPSNAMVVRKDGRVGIGISAPRYLLHVADGDITASNDSETRIAVTDTSNGQSAAILGLAKSNNGTIVEAQLVANGNTSLRPTGVYMGSVSSHSLRLTAGGLTHMEITASGNVGIHSTNTPQEDLVVGHDLGDFAGTRITIGDSENASGLNIGEDSNNRGFILWNDGFNHLNFGTKSSTGTYSNTLVVKDGNIGVKNTSPIYDLHVGNGNISATNASNTRMAVTDNTNGERAAILGLAKTGSGSKVEAQLEANGSTNAGPSVIIGASTSHPVYLRTGNATRMTINTSGNVGIGTTTPDYKLEVVGSAAKSTGASWTNTSDRRLKNNIRDYNAGLTDILRIRPVQFRYNAISGYDMDKEHVGVIAQELQEFSPHMIGSIVKDGVEYLTVNNSAMTYMLINAVRELDYKNKLLKAELDELRSLKIDIDKLNARLDEQITSQD